MSTLQTAIEIWRKNPNSPSAVRQSDKEIRKVAKQTLQQRNVPDGDIDDLTQEVATKMWSLLRKNCVHTGAESGFLWRLGRNAAESWRKRKHRREILVEAVDESIPTFPTEHHPQTHEVGYHQSPEVQYQDKEQSTKRRQQIEKLLASMPPSPQKVIRCLYLEGKELSELAEERFRELLAKSDPQHPPQTSQELKELRKTAHNWVTANKKRGILFLQAHLQREQE